MKSFMAADFLLDNKTAEDLYIKYAKDMPIYDYHCHLSPKEIAQDKAFYDIGELMLSGDHYKWRIMRACGIDENCITGNAPYKEKFIAFAKALSGAVGNPVYHWAHMELAHYFNLSLPLNEKNAEQIYETANRKMADGSFTARRLIEKSGVTLLATTEGPCDNLEWHKRIKEITSFKTKVVPTFRPDIICSPLKEGLYEYIRRLSNIEKTDIKTLDDLLDVIKKRMDYFQSLGCMLADHGMTDMPQTAGTHDDASRIFSDILAKRNLNKTQAEQYLFFMLTFFAGEYARRGWVMQLHMSVVRNQNSAMFKAVGADRGFDSVGDTAPANALGQLFDRIESSSGLPRTIVYTLNPSAYYVLSTAIGNFAGGIPGKMQFGAAWWFCDHKEGILNQLKTLAHTGVLGQFVGMLTDSRSFVSYIRHDYFRRILCSLLGEWAESGEIPNDPETLERLIKGICYENAKAYFRM